MSLNGIGMPKDSQGREIPLSTETMYFLDGRKAKVSAFEYWPYWYRWQVKVFGYDKHVLASDLLLFLPIPGSSLSTMRRLHQEIICKQGASRSAKMGASPR